MTLRLKLLVLVAGVTVFSTMGVTSVALWRELQRGQELLLREGAAMAASAAPAASRWMPGGEALPGASEALQPVMRRLVERAPIDRAWAVDHAGRLVACLALDGGPCPAGAPTDLAPDMSPARIIERLLDRQKLVAGAPVTRDGVVVGAVRVEFRREELVGNARRLAWSAALVAAAWILLGTVLAGVLISAITRSLRGVVDASRALGQEESGIQLAVPGDRELAELVVAFNQLSHRLKERCDEHQSLIAELERRVEEKTREVLRADRLATLGGIAAGFAHELGNSLNVIRGYTAVALRELPQEHPNRPDLEAVRRETQRAASLLERFLVFARSRSTAPVAQPVEPIVREAVEVVGPAAAEAGVVTSVQVEPGLPDIWVDAEMLRQAILNLCVNAIQAMRPDGGRLEARLRSDEGWVAIELQDSGPGIAEEVRKHVFEPFFTTKADGTGLGLAIVRQAAETHGGAVEVESQPGHGALFRLRLPAAHGGAQS